MTLRQLHRIRTPHQSCYLFVIHNDVRFVQYSYIKAYIDNSNKQIRDMTLCFLLRNSAMLYQLQNVITSLDNIVVQKLLFITQVRILFNNADNQGRLLIR